MSKGRESKLKDFYVVRQSPPTSTPPSTPGLRISLSEPFQGFNRLQLTSSHNFEFLNIRYAACEIRLAVEVPETFCPNSVYRLSGSVNLQDTRKENGDDSQAEISEDTFGEHNNSDTTAIENESHEEIPNQSSAEDVPTTSPIRRILPQRQNRGIPKPTYEHDLFSRVKYPMSHFVSNHRLSESNQSFVNQLSTVSIPNSVQEALKDPKWKATMNDKMRSLQKNQTWELVDLSPRKKPVGCRWIYIIKYKADDSIERYKARLVAKGYTQTYGIDYTNTFAPVAKINTIRILLSLAVNLDWPVQQFDVKNAFLYGDLSEEIYMDLPPGCSGPKQLNQKWTRTTQLESMQIEEIIVRVEAIPKSMVREIHKGYVTGNDEEEREALQKYLSREFEIKDLGTLKYFLKIEVSRSKGGIFLSQRKYALDLLHEKGMTACQPIDTLIEEGLKFCITSDQVPVDKGRYQRLIGRLMYLSHTRPDLAYALSVVSQFMHNPEEKHMKAVMRILSALGVTALWRMSTHVLRDCRRAKKVCVAAASCLQRVVL
ncbi:protein kinase domain-containing protein [Citrus sinensis]|uniref:Protein kinase domain-containing protein n=1 Tax=Citrus sinensis TaxID=2711 RepID=A0ACB8JSV3_CITSI|nr:protein kinase domain-containing protein [Citrus sinensis]